MATDWLGCQNATVHLEIFQGESRGFWDAELIGDIGGNRETNIKLERLPLRSETAIKIGELLSADLKAMGSLLKPSDS